MKILLTFCLLILSRLTVCCSCIPQKEFKTANDLKQYDYIAFVEIVKLAPLTAVPNYFNTRQSGDIKVRTIELFKGKADTILLDLSYNTNCLIEAQEGQRWLMFGNLTDERVNVTRCSYSMVYSQLDGKRDWQYFNGIKELDKLRRIYNHKPPVISTLSKYPNGNIEYRQSFKNGMLNGVRDIYYPNGKLFIKEKFKEGKRVDFRKVYRPNGSLERIVKYDKNAIISDISYQDTAEISWWYNYRAKNINDPLFGSKGHKPEEFYKALDSLKKTQFWLKPIEIERIFNGPSYKMMSFNANGNLRAKRYMDWDKKTLEHWLYYDNGEPQMHIMLNQKEDKEVEHDYDQSGKTREFIKKCESCQYDFNEKHLPSVPEKIYVQ